MGEKKCLYCEYVKLLDELFCEWECTEKESPCFGNEVEPDDGCPFFREKKDLWLRGTVTKLDLIRSIRGMGKDNEKAMEASRVSDDYHDGYLDALTELISWIYKGPEK